MLDHSCQVQRHPLRERRGDTAFAVLDLLCERFPKCFARLERRRRPLKIGIYLDLLAALDGTVAPLELARALRVYTANIRYLSVCWTGAARIDLDGNAAGEVSPEHAGRASARRDRQRARLAARRKQQAEQRKAAAAVRLRSSLADLRAAAQRRKAGAP